MMNLSLICIWIWLGCFNSVTCQTAPVKEANYNGSRINFIIGGELAAPSQLPWQAAVYVFSPEDSFWNFECGGTLIRPRWVVTAAHCFNEYQSPVIFVELGANNLFHNSTEQSRNVIGHFDHESYDMETFFADISLLELDTEVVYNDYLQPAILPNFTTTVTPGESCIVSGYGFTEKKEIQTLLNFAKIEIINFNTCQKWYSSSDISLPVDHFCAGNITGSVDTCKYDSGGPLVRAKLSGKSTDYILMGITSFGSGCGQQRRPGVYTNVVTYLDWIMQYIEPVVPPAPSSQQTTVRTTQKNNPSSSRQWPWQAVVCTSRPRDSSRKCVCGGALVGPRWVVTAAHCFEEYERLDILVLFGVHDLRCKSSTEQSRVVSRPINHPSYNSSTLFADISLLELETAVIYNDYVQPAILPSSATNVRSHHSCVVSGYGLPRGMKKEGILNHDKVRIIPLHTCKSWYSSSSISVPDDHVCAGKNRDGVDSCQGNSGSPLVCAKSHDKSADYVLVGVTSFGERCGKRRRPAVYTNIVSYLDWIMQYNVSAPSQEPSCHSPRTTTTSNGVEGRRSEPTTNSSETRIARNYFVLLAFALLQHSVRSIN